MLILYYYAPLAVLLLRDRMVRRTLAYCAYHGAQAACVASAAAADAGARGVALAAVRLANRRRRSAYTLPPTSSERQAPHTPM